MVSSDVCMQTTGTSPFIQVKPLDVPLDLDQQLIHSAHNAITSHLEALRHEFSKGESDFITSWALDQPTSNKKSKIFKFWSYPTPPATSLSSPTSRKRKHDEAIPQPPFARLPTTYAFPSSPLPQFLNKRRKLHNVDHWTSSLSPQQYVIITARTKEDKEVLINPPCHRKLEDIMKLTPVQRMYRTRLGGRNASFGSPQVEEQANRFRKRVVLRVAGCAVAVPDANQSSGEIAGYRPWRDGTITPRNGSVTNIPKERNNVVLQSIRSNDDCTMLLQKWRDQLNVVINMQIHLRSLIRNAASPISLLMSINHSSQIPDWLVNAAASMSPAAMSKEIEQFFYQLYQPAYSQMQQMQQQQQALQRQQQQRMLEQQAILQAQHDAAAEKSNAHETSSSATNLSSLPTPESKANDEPEKEMGKSGAEAPEVLVQRVA